MKELNHIDDMFQQHFAETAVPMSNQEEMWQRISEKKDDRAIGFWWKGLLGVGLLVVAGVFIITSANGNERAIVENNVAAVDNYQNSNNEKEVIVAANDESELSENREELIENNIESIKKKATAKNQIIKWTSTSKINDAKNEIVEPVNEVATEGGNDFISSQLSIAVPIKIESTVIDQVDLKFERTSSAEGVNGLGLTSLKYDDEGFRVPYDESWDKCEVKEKGHFFADIYGQGGLPQDEIGFSTAGDDEFALLDLWETRFAPKASWHAGGQIGYQWPSSLRVSAGAEYQEIITEYTDNQRVTEVIRVYDPQAFFTIDMNGDRVWVGDTVTAINIYDRQFVRKNTHTLFHIPVQVGYDIYKRPKFHIGLDIGAALNISKTYEGQYIRQDQTLIVVDDNNQENHFSNDIGISFSAGLHFGKYLNDNWEVYASPRFRYNPNSYLLDTETLKVTRNFMALRVGIRRHF